MDNVLCKIWETWPGLLEFCANHHAFTLVGGVFGIIIWVMLTSVMFG